MKKDVLIALVHEKVNGGNAKPTSSVWKDDLEAYLPAAVNEAVMEGFYIQDKTEGDRDIGTEFYGFFNDLPVLKDATRKSALYFERPKNLISMPSGRAIRRVFTSSNIVYTPIGDAALRGNLEYWLKVYCDERFFNQVGSKIYLHNHPVLTTKMNMIMLVSVEDLAPDADLPIPAGLEAKVIDNLYRYAVGERKEPADRVVDGRDLN